MTDEELREATNEMWADMRAAGEMLRDTDDEKLGMPYPCPYEVVLPYEVEGVYCPITVSHEVAERIAKHILAIVPEAKRLTASAEASLAAHDAICKAQDSAKGE